jgi:malate synthase
MSDEMCKMVEPKAGDPDAGANNAWVPSPTMATLHAQRYPQVKVAKRQAELARRGRTNLTAILTPHPLDRRRTADEIVDRQTDDGPIDRRIAPEFDKSLAFQAALDLIFNGNSAAKGHTEPVLHARRRQVTQSGQ